MPGWLHAIHVAVASYPAGAETYFSPLKVYEYLAAGVPVVSTMLPALADVPDVARAPDAAAMVALLDAALHAGDTWTVS